MGGTTAHGIPYVTATDKPKEFPTHSQALATVIEATTRVARGTVAIPVVGAGASSSTVNITFPAGMFSGAPSVAVMPGNSRISTAFQSVSASGAVLIFSNWTSTATPGATTGTWIAAGT